MGFKKAIKKAVKKVKKTVNSVIHEAAKPVSKATGLDQATVETAAKLGAGYATGGLTGAAIGLKSASDENAALMQKQNAGVVEQEQETDENVDQKLSGQPTYDEDYGLLALSGKRAVAEQGVLDEELKKNYRLSGLDNSLGHYRASWSDRTGVFGV